jgi:hypothetical protein
LAGEKVRRLGSRKGAKHVLSEVEGDAKFGKNRGKFDG